MPKDNGIVSSECWRQVIVNLESHTLPNSRLNKGQNKRHFDTFSILESFCPVDLRWKRRAQGLGAQEVMGLSSISDLSSAPASLRSSAQPGTAGAQLRFSPPERQPAVFLSPHGSGPVPKLGTTASLALRALRRPGPPPWGPLLLRGQRHLTEAYRWLEQWDKG